VITFGVVGHIPVVPGHWAALWPVGADAYGPDWDGYHYRGVGLLRHVRLPGLRFTATAAEPPGTPPTWQVFDDPATESLQLEVALWWQQAYRADRSDPALIAEHRWWPGLEGSQPFHRVVQKGTAAITQGDLAAAERARRLLSGQHPKLKTGPERGTGGAPPRYRTREQWHAAIHAEVLTKKRHANAPGRTVAAWLDISRATLNALLKNDDFGPPWSLNDLRKGNF
jgi:hypothetical protein